MNTLKGNLNFLLMQNGKNTKEIDAALKGGHHVDVYVEEKEKMWGSRKSNYSDGYLWVFHINAINFER